MAELGPNPTVANIFFFYLSFNRFFNVKSIKFSCIKLLKLHIYIFNNFIFKKYDRFNYKKNIDRQLDSKKVGFNPTGVSSTVDL